MWVLEGDKATLLVCWQYLWHALAIAKKLVLTTVEKADAADERPYLQPIMQALQHALKVVRSAEEGIDTIRSCEYLSLRSSPQHNMPMS